MRNDLICEHRTEETNLLTAKPIQFRALKIQAITLCEKTGFLQMTFHIQSQETSPVTQDFFDLWHF